MADWSELPTDILELFAKQIPPYAEAFARFISVCKSFRSVAIDSKLGSNPFGPWLLLPKSRFHIGKSDSSSTRAFFSVSSNQRFHLRLPFSELQGDRCWGSPYGWLVTLGMDLNMHLLNPLTSSQLSLPPQHTFNHKYEGESNGLYPNFTPEEWCRNLVFKLVLASNPSFWTTPPAHDQFCMAIYGEYRRLAFAFPGDESWTPIETPYPGHNDVIFFRGHTYAVSTQGVLRFCDINTTPPTGTDIASPPSGLLKVDRFYLVEMFGDLHLVARFTTFNRNSRWPEKRLSTTYFEVFRFGFHLRTWTRVSHLGNQALFVGINASFAISTADHPDVKANCIYFTDDHLDTYSLPSCDMGVSHYVDKTVKPVYNGYDILTMLTRPTFFLPSM